MPCCIFTQILQMIWYSNLLKYNAEKVRPQFLSVRQGAAGGQSLCWPIGPEKPRNSAVFRGRLCTLGWGRKLEMSLCGPAFSAAVHLAHSVPVQIAFKYESDSDPPPDTGFEFSLGWARCANEPRPDAEIGRRIRGDHRMPRLRASRKEPVAVAGYAIS
jgi:hypothetical protein